MTTAWERAREAVAQEFDAGEFDAEVVQKYAADAASLRWAPTLVWIMQDADVMGDSDDPQLYIDRLHRIRDIAKEALGDPSEWPK